MMIEQQINITKQRSVFSTIPHIEWKMQFGLKSVMSEFHAWNWKTTIVWKTIPPTSMNVIDRRAKKCAYKSNFQVPNNWQSTNANNEKVQWCGAQCGMKWKTETFALNSKLTFVSMSKRLILHAHREREIEEDRGRFTCHVSYTSVTLSVCFVCFVWLWIAFEQAENGNEFVRKNRFVFVSFTHGPFIV